jgi:hypothetical protein
MSKQQIIDLAAEVAQLREQASEGEDINKLFEFADRAKLFEDTWRNAASKKGGKPKTFTNPYTGTTVKRGTFNNKLKKAPVYKKTFRELASKYSRDEFVTRLLSGFSDAAKDSLRKLITDNQETIPELANRYAEIQRRGIGEIERVLAEQAKAKLPDQEVRVEVPEELPRAPPSPPQIRGERVQGVFQQLLGDPVPPPAVPGIAERVQDVVARGVDVARIPYQDLMNNMARRVMRRDLLPAPVMERRRGRGARDWKGWMVDTVRNVGTAAGALSSIVGLGSYLYYAIMGNTPKKNKPTMEEILKDAGVVPDGTIEDAMKIKTQIETVMAQGGGEVPARETPTEEAQQEEVPAQQEETVLDAEEFQRRVEEARDVERRQREATQDTQRDPQPPPLTRPPIQYPDLRKGHLETIAMEQLLRLKKEEEDRRIATLYTQNPDDYMSPSVPNPYERPMYSDEWVDIKRLQRLQTPEYTRQEREIWARNYQTPYQLGEGTADNSVKDIKNVVERIAQLERRLRYDYATKGLPRDERQPAVNWGAPMQRMGVAPKNNSRHERWDAYLDVVRKYDMDKYQYLQRQNEPPHSKLINRDAVFGLTRPTPDIPSQQKIYDEQMNTQIGSEDYLDIQNEMDYAYFRRRIRKD